MLPNNAEDSSTTQQTILIVFICFLADPWETLENCQGDSLTGAPTDSLLSFNPFCQLDFHQLAFCQIAFHSISLSYTKPDVR